MHPPHSNYSVYTSACFDRLNRVGTGAKKKKSRWGIYNSVAVCVLFLEWLFTYFLGLIVEVMWSVPPNFPCCAVCCETITNIFLLMLALFSYTSTYYVILSFIDFLSNSFSFCLFSPLSSTFLIAISLQCRLLTRSQTFHFFIDFY